MLNLKLLLWLLVVAMCEEFFFRDFLLRIALKWLHYSHLQAALLTSALFAGAHFVNLTNGLEINYVVVQVCLALGMGMLLASLYFKYGLLACIFLHGFINITSVFVTAKTDFALGCYLLLAILSFLYGTYVVRHMERRFV